MAELLNSFLKLAKEDEDNLSVESLLTEEERIEWETLVKALDSIDIMNVGKDLEKIDKMVTSKRWQELSILAYVKLLEMMMVKAKASGAMDGLTPPKRPRASKTEYTGSMFG